MKPIVTIAEFAALRRQVPLAALVADIERRFRAAIGVENFNDDDIIVATLDPAEQTDAERAMLHVVRACIAYREAAAEARLLWLDHLAVKIAAADPALVAGLGYMGRVKRGGQKTAEARKRAAAEADERLRRAALKVLAAKGPMKHRALAAHLADEGYGGREAIRKKLPRLLRPKVPKVDR